MLSSEGLSWAGRSAVAKRASYARVKTLKPEQKEKYGNFAFFATGLYRLYRRQAYQAIRYSVKPPGILIDRSCQGVLIVVADNILIARDGTSRPTPFVTLVNICRWIHPGEMGSHEYLLDRADVRAFPAEGAA